MEQQNDASQEKFTQPLVVMFETLRKSGSTGGWGGGRGLMGGGGKEGGGGVEGELTNEREGYIPI